MGLTTGDDASLQLHSSTANITDRTRIDEANKLFSSEMDKILGTLSGQIDQGLGLVSGGADNQAKFDQAFANAQGLVGQSVQPGQVDFSNYNPYMQLGNATAIQAGILSGAYTTNSRDGLQAGYDSQGRLVLTPGGVDIRPITSQDIYNQYLNNPAVQAQMDQGTRQINASSAATGSLRSGSVLKALQSYGQGIASQGIGQAQDNLYKLAGLGAQSANQYATALLNKYQTDQQAQLGSLQNQTAAVGQQANLLNAQNAGQQNQLSFLSSLANTQATLASQAAAQRQSSLAGSATKYTDEYGMGYGGTRSSVNTQYNFS